MIRAAARSYSPNLLFADSVKPEAFGAAADGVTNDTAAFVLARDACIGRAIELTPGKSYCLKSFAANAAGCTGIFSRGGKATILPTSDSTSGISSVIITVDDFTVDNIFFDLNTSTSQTVAPASSAAIRYSGTAGTRIRVTNCRFRGGTSGVNFNPGTVSNTYIVGNTFSGTWSDAISCAVGGNVYITDNIMEDCGFDTSSTSGAIRVGYTNNGVTSENCIIARNTIKNCCINGTMRQSSIDCYSPAARNILIIDNVCDLNGSGIEVKTDNSLFADDVYQNIVISRNMIRLLSDSGVIGIGGISINTTTTVPSTKVRNILVEANHIFQDTLADINDGTVGIGFSAAYANATVRGNTILRVARGITLAVQSVSPDLNLDGLVIEGNDMIVANLGVYNNTTGDAINDLFLGYNRITAGGQCLVLANTPVNRAIIKENAFIATGSSTAIDLRDMHDSLFIGNVVVGAASSYGIVINATASTNLRLVRNDITTDPSTGLDAVRVNAGVVDIIDNSVTVPAGKTGVLVSAGTVRNRTNRGYASASNTASHAHALGDYWINDLSASSVIEFWRCTSAGAAGANTLKTVALA